MKYIQSSQQRHQKDAIDFIITPCFSVSIVNFEQVDAGWHILGALSQAEPGPQQT